MKQIDIGPVRQLWLDRPERRNALGTEGMQQLATALRDAATDPSVRTIVLVGAPPAFCAGSDLKELAGLDVDGMCEHETATASVARIFASHPKPIVAAVEGYALGGGFILAVSCDLVVSGVHTRWHLPEVANGWLPPWGLHALEARVGPVRARMLTWGADPIDGLEAYRLGIADYTAPAGQALEIAMDVAAKLCALPPEAVTSCKRYFEPRIAGNGEHFDRVATRQFADDCASPAAQATFSKFSKVKA
ncbi:enoyl-CoA hydratase/isomerase family protein [Cupriavidus sp. 8B]